MRNQYGFDPERDRWSRRATEDLFPLVAKAVFNTDPQNVIYAWNDPGIDRIDTHYGVDILLHTPRRNVALAARIRGCSYYYSHGDITIRLDSLQTLGKMLEMQKSIARFMFYGWGNTDKSIVPTKLIDWHIVYLQRLVDQFLLNKLPYTGPFPNKDRSSRLVGFSTNTLMEHGLLFKSCTNAPGKQLVKAA